MFNLKRVSVLSALLVMLTINTLAVLLPLNGKTTKELSDAIPVYFVPEGYVFSIWSLIYIALIGYTVYQLLPSNQKNKQLHRIAWLFVINALSNAGWIVLWHHEQVVWSVGLMLVILGTLIAIYQMLGIGQIKVKPTQYWLTHAPFSLYLGWISVATIANISGALYVLQWDGWGIEPQVWAAIMIVVAGVLALTMLLRRADYIFAAVIIWALVGIAVKFSTVSVMLWAVIAMVSCIVVTALGIVAKNKLKSSSW